MNEAAEQVGVTDVCWRYWESGKKKPGDDNMTKIVNWSDGAVQPNDFYNIGGVDSQEGFQPSCAESDAASLSPPSGDDGRDDSDLRALPSGHRAA